MEPAPLAGSEIHGFRTTADLNIVRLMEDASKRWLRPNEIYAILSNYTHLKIQPQPVLNPESGNLLLFDRNVLRNFRKDGHNWRKKKDGKTVQEAHEKLKIGVEERIHVYYARSEDDPSFYRRCYWLLDRNLDRIVLVHYRRTLEDFANQQLSVATQCRGSLPVIDKLHASTPLNSTSSSNHVETSGSVVFSEEINSNEDNAIYGGSGISRVNKPAEVENYDLTLDMINKFDWESLLGTEVIANPVYPETLSVSSERGEGNTLSSYQMVEDGQSLRDNGNLENSGGEHPVSMNTPHGFVAINQPLEGYLQPAEVNQNAMLQISTSMDAEFQGTDFQTVSKIPDACVNGALQSEPSFGQWEYIVDNTPGSLNDLQLDCQVSNVEELKAVADADQLYSPEPLFNITDISPAWSYSNEKTKV